jgi:uncharacterized membrane protein
MLPVTHGVEFTRLHVLLYTIILFGVTMLPFATRLSGRALPKRRRMRSGLHVHPRTRGG